MSFAGTFDAYDQPEPIASATGVVPSSVGSGSQAPSDPYPPTVLVPLGPDMADAAPSPYDDLSLGAQAVLLPFPDGRPAQEPMCSNKLAQIAAVQRGAAHRIQCLLDGASPEEYAAAMGLSPTAVAASASPPPPPPYQPQAVQIAPVMQHAQPLQQPPAMQQPQGDAAAGGAVVQPQAEDPWRRWQQHQQWQQQRQQQQQRRQQHQQQRPQSCQQHWHE